MSRLGAGQLAAEVGSPRFWRRETARRLLVERQLKEAAPLLARLAREPAEPVAVLNALHTLDGLGGLGPGDVESALGHPDPGVRRQALRFAERWLDADPRMLDRVLALAADTAPMVRLQLALSLGESGDARVLSSLVHLARSHGDDPWMVPAILTAVPGRGGALLTELLRSPAELGKAEGLLEPLCAAIANRRHGPELSQALVRVAALENRRLQANCLRGMRSSLRGPTTVELSASARASVKTLSLSPDAAVRSQALQLIAPLGIETPAERRARLAQAAGEVGDVRLSVEARLAAVDQLAADDDPEGADTLLAALPSSTPQVRDAILGAILGRRDRLPALLDALEAKTVPASFLGAVQRATLLDAGEPEIRRRAAALLKSTSAVNDEVFAPYVQALQVRRDGARGQQVFREKCASCHQAHGLGHAVGPDLSAEFQRAEETIIRDVLAPSDTISPGYVTYTVATEAGQVFSGLLVAESPTSLTLRQAEGKEQVVLRKDVDEVRAMSVSMMPEDLPKTVAPRDLADLLAWLRRPPTSLILVDENRELIEALNEGAGMAEFIAADRHAGQVSLRITPPQRFSPRIEGWEFRIRENPGPGEYRYLRFAWKSAGADGVMLELAADGRWPPAERPLRRYHAGRNTTGWQSVETSPSAPRGWTVVTRDLWGDFGEFTLTGIAPTAMGGDALFDRVELLQVAAGHEKRSSSSRMTGRHRRGSGHHGGSPRCTSSPTTPSRPSRPSPMSAQGRRLAAVPRRHLGRRRPDRRGDRRLTGLHRAGRPEVGGPLQRRRGRRPGRPPRSRPQAQAAARRARPAAGPDRGRAHRRRWRLRLPRARRAADPPRRVRRRAVRAGGLRPAAPARPQLADAPAGASQERPRGAGGVQKGAPERVGAIAAAHPAERVEVWFADEARFGQQGTLTRVWARRGSRPRGVRQTEYDWCYVMTAVCPATGQAAGLIMPSLNMATVSDFLAEVSLRLAPGVHAVLIWDNAGFHTGGSVAVPPNITLLALPPYAPELNPVENLWHYFRAHHWSLRVFKDYEALKEAAVTAWRAVCLVPELVRSISLPPTSPRR